jgi:hypothetical protein
LPRLRTIPNDVFLARLNINPIAYNEADRPASTRQPAGCFGSVESTEAGSRRHARNIWPTFERRDEVRAISITCLRLKKLTITRLNDFKTQETYYNRIVEKYMKFCAANSSSSNLDAQFAALSVSSTSLTSKPSLMSSKYAPPPPEPPVRPPLAVHPPNATATTGELPAILQALRKLREAITATGRKDQFVQRAYTFNVHTAILCEDWESYSPALLSLLNVIHPARPLSSTELHEYVGYYILDLACRQGDILGAHSARLLYKYKDRRVELVLKALVADNWVMFWKMKKAVDGYQRRIMKYAEQGTRVHALKCLGRGYMQADRRYVERCADRKWEDLVKDGVGWELVENDKVIIKKPKAK